MIRVAVIGAGSMAREHIRAFSALPGVNVSGVHSRTREWAETLAAEFGIAAVCDDIPMLKQASRADLVVVAVPELSVNAVAKAAFAEDWAVLLEKPAGLDLADAEDVAAAARARTRPVMVGLNRRFYSSTRAVLMDVAQRDERRFVHVQDQQSFAEARRHNHPEAVVEKFMYANSIHVVDLILTLCRGEVSKVMQIMPWRGGGTEVVLAHVEFESGDSAVYEGLWQGPGPWACSVSTPSRRWTLQPLERAVFQNANERTQNPVELDPVDIDYKPGCLRQAEAVIARVRGEDVTTVDLDESLRTMRLINQIFGV